TGTVIAAAIKAGYVANVSGVCSTPASIYGLRRMPEVIAASNTETPVIPRPKSWFIAVKSMLFLSMRPAKGAYPLRRFGKALTLVGSDFLELADFLASQQNTEQSTSRRQRWHQPLAVLCQPGCALG